MTTHDAPTGNDPPKKRLTVASKINDYRPKLFATLTPEGIVCWNKYEKKGQLVRREEIEAFWAQCKAWSEQCQAEAGQDEPCEDGERPDIAV